jgi:hypothetical protein
MQPWHSFPQAVKPGLEVVVARIGSSAAASTPDCLGNFGLGHRSRL